jgi:tetratricopeptide (TPR) repeat protein
VRRPAGPPLPEWADPRELDQPVRAALRGLDPRNAELVAKHLVVAGTLVDEDPQLALVHAQAARDRASRIAVVREAVGVAAYHAGDFAEAARELRAYRRMTGDDSYRAVLADCERALGRPEVALRLVAEALAARPDRDETAELRLVEAGARQDLGESAAARLVLEDALGGRPTPESLTAGADPARIRLAAAYADLLDAVGEAAAAERWRSAVLEADPEGATGAVERPEVEFDELDEDDAAADEDELPAGDGSDAPEAGTGDGAGADVESEVEPDIESDSEPDLDDDIEAEVAELLGEDPPAR